MILNIMGDLKKIQKIFKTAVKNKWADFYRSFYDRGGFTGRSIESREDFEKIPVMTADYLVHTPLNQRRYRKDGGFTKIVRAHNTVFLIHRTLKDLREENYGISQFKRPLVMMTDNNEALEKAMWLYEHGALPLIGELGMPDAIAGFAKKYAVDAVLSDADALNDFWPELTAVYDPLNIKSLAIFGSRFEINGINPAIAAYNPRFILSLPETGAFAQSCPRSPNDKEIVFHPDGNSLVEIEKNIILTKTVFMTTPIIRYDTGIEAEGRPENCTCEKQSFVLK